MSTPDLTDMHERIEALYAEASALRLRREDPTLTLLMGALADASTYAEQLCQRDEWEYQQELARQEEDDTHEHTHTEEP